MYQSFRVTFTSIRNYIISFDRLYLQIGAVNGSEEFRLGVSLNADVKRKNDLSNNEVA